MSELTALKMPGIKVFHVQAILEESRGQVLVKWVGFPRPTLEPVENLKHTAAYMRFSELVAAKALLILRENYFVC